MKEDSQKSNKMLAIIIFLIIVFILAVGVYLFILQNFSKTTKNNITQSEIDNITLDKTLNFNYLGVSFKLNYPSQWSACSEESNAEYEGVVASIQSLSNTCSVWFAMDREYQTSDVHIDVATYNITEDNLSTWVGKRVFEAEKNGFDYTIDVRSDGSILTTTIDTNGKFDSFTTYRLMSLYKTSDLKVYEVKVYIAQEKYNQYEKVINDILNSFKINLFMLFSNQGLSFNYPEDFNVLEEQKNLPTDNLFVVYISPTVEEESTDAPQISISVYQNSGNLSVVEFINEMQSNSVVLLPGALEGAIDTAYDSNAKTIEEKLFEEYINKTTDERTAFYAIDREMIVISELGLTNDVQDAYDLILETLQYK